MEVCALEEPPATVSASTQLRDGADTDGSLLRRRLCVGVHRRAEGTVPALMGGW